MEHTATSTENVASSNGQGIETGGVPVPTVPVKRRRTNKTVPPTNCTRCKKSVKGQCMLCQIEELKLLVKEKYRMNKIIETALEKSEKKAASLERKLKHRMEKYRKRLNTEVKRRNLMEKYAMVIILYLIIVYLLWRNF